jgi:hypothetical protein
LDHDKRAVNRSAGALSLAGGWKRKALALARLMALPALLLATAASPPAQLLREQAWTAPGQDLARALTHTPGECLAARTPQTEIGRALFRSPGLLGGPVARLGVSCNACHSNGRVNTAFLLPELTNRAGAADVTSEWASHVRGDGVMNPVDIPDLAGVGARPTHGHAGDPSLDHFAHSVIVEEFQGHEPPPQAMASLVAYLRALDVNQCAPPHRLTLSDAAENVRRTLASTATADAATTQMLIFAAQDGVGRIVERLPARRFAAQRRQFEQLAYDLIALRNAPDPQAALVRGLPAWRARFDALVARVGRQVRATYFNEARLRAALRR